MRTTKGGEAVSFSRCWRKRGEVAGSASVGGNWKKGGREGGEGMGHGARDMGQGVVHVE